MKNSNKRRRARYEKFRKKSSLNLVSLMDIFTILVFFLLVSSGNSQKLPNSNIITLPTSIAEKSPKETIVILITQKEILVDGRQVAKIENILFTDNNDIVIPELQKELLFLYAKNYPLSNKLDTSGKTDLKVISGSVTIMGDEKIPYELLRKILATCRQANYTKIAFAAVQKSKKT